MRRPKYSQVFTCRKLFLKCLTVLDLRCRWIYSSTRCRGNKTNRKTVETKISHWSTGLYMLWRISPRRLVSLHCVHKKAQFSTYSGMSPFSSQSSHLLKVSSQNKDIVLLWSKRWSKCSLFRFQNKESYRTFWNRYMILHYLKLFVCSDTYIFT